MAKLIILDGLSRTGKTSISNKLKNEGFGRIISLSDKRPIGVDIQSYYKGVSSISNEFFKVFPNETFILDRSFLSELVYCKFFKRESSATKDYIKDLIEHNKIILFYLHNTYSDYKNRNPKDTYIFSEDEYEYLKKLFLIEKTNIPIESFSIDTSLNNLNKVYNEIKNLLKHHE